MKLLSNVSNGSHPMFTPRTCKICGAWLYYTVHTVHGHFCLCKSHTDEELESYIEACKDKPQHLW